VHARGHWHQQNPHAKLLWQVCPAARPTAATPRSLGWVEHVILLCFGISGAESPSPQRRGPDHTPDWKARQMQSCGLRCLPRSGMPVIVPLYQSPPLSMMSHAPPTKPDKQTHDAICSVFAIIQHNKYTLENPTYVAFTDYSTAYPSVHRDDLSSHSRHPQRITRRESSKPDFIRYICR